MTKILKEFGQKKIVFEECFWIKFNNLGLALGMVLKSYISVAEGLKITVRKFWDLVPTFIEGAREKLVGGLFAPPISFLPE